MKDNPGDPDIKAIAALAPLPGIGAANLWSLGEKTLKGTLELGNVSRRIASGLSAEQWAASQLLKQEEKLRASAEAASKMGPIGRGAERVANVIDDSGQAIMRGLGNIPGAGALKDAVERAGEFLEESGVPKPLQQGAKALGSKVVAGAAVGSVLDDDMAKGAAVGAGLGALALGTPRFIADLSRASAKNAKGIGGVFGTLSQDPTRGWMSRLATVRPEAVDWIAGHLSDMTKNAVHVTPMAVTLGLMDSNDPEGFVKAMMEGWAWAAGPQLFQKALGKDPTQMQRERSKYDHQVYKLKSSMSPDAVTRFNVFANIEAEVAAAEQYLQNATQNYQKAIEGQEESDTPSEKAQYYQAMVNKAQIRLEAAKKNAATPEGRAEFEKQFWYRLADIDAHISGSIEPGKNVKVELLTTNEMLDKLGESNSRTMAELGGPLPAKPMSQWGPEELNMLSPEQRAYYQRLMFMSEAEGASYLKQNTVRKSDGQRVDRRTGQHVVWDPKMEKGTIALNSDVIIKNMIQHGDAFLSVYSHEMGHQLDSFDEYKKRTAGLREKLFGTERKDAGGFEVARTEGMFSDQHLFDLFMQKYGRSNANLTPEQVAENMGLYNSKTGEYDMPGIVRVMRDEVIADFNAIGLYRNYFFNQPRGAAALINWMTLKGQNGRAKALARRIAGLRDDASTFGERSGAEFTPEAQRLIEQHMRDLKSLRGNMAPHNPEEVYTPPVSKKDIIANSELSEYYLTESGRFKTEMAGVVYDADGKIVAEVVLQDPEAKEGSWFHHLDENGRNEITQGHGDGELPPELADLPIPMGGHLMSVVRLARDASGKPVENSNKETREAIEQRSQAIRDAIDNSGDLGAPDRLRPIAPGSNSYRGTLTDAQIEAIRRLPNRVVPYSIKKKLYDINGALKKGDGTRLLLDYATRIDARGRYVPFSPKIQDVVPIGMMFSNDGHFLVTTVSISRMMSKLDRWEAFMPLRLKPWNGSKSSFMEEFVGSYLENHQNGLPGSGFDPSTGEAVPGAKQLGRDAAEAETKRNIFNDFLNMYDSNTVESNPDRTELPPLRLTREQRQDDRLVKLSKEQRKAEKSSDQNTMVRSLRLDSIMDLVESDLKKIPVDYYKAKHNFSLENYEQLQRPGASERPLEDATEMLRGMSLNVSRSPDGMPMFSLRSGQQEPAAETMIEPGLYSQLGRTLLQKMPAKTSANQVRDILRGGGVKADEMRWSGIMPFIERVQSEKGSVTKEDIQSFLRDSYAARFEEVDSPEKLYGKKFKMNEGLMDGDFFNYRETILTHPDTEFVSENHYPGVDNYVAHMRLQDVFAKDPVTNETLVGTIIEEAQSDLHQPGRKKGYYTEDQAERLVTLREQLAKAIDARTIAFERKIRTLDEKLRVTSNAKYNESMAKVDDLSGQIELLYNEAPALRPALNGTIWDGLPQGAPEAPFSKDWPLQLFKRALRDAVGDSADYQKHFIAWPAGQVQADRYKLERAVDSIVVAYSKNGYQLNATKGNRSVISKGSVTEGELKEIIGKELTESALRKLEESNNKFTAAAVFSGDDLKVGGRGMKVFYDSIFPTEVGKYVRQWGVKPEPSFVYKNGSGHALWKIDITPEMAESVRQGQALFSLRSGGEPAPESINQEQYGRRNIEEEARFGGAGRGRDPQEAGRPSGEIRSRARILEDSVRRADSEARQVRGESEGRRSSKSAKRAQDAALVEAASQQGMLLDPSDFLKRWRESGERKGAEHLVALNAKNGFVEKRTNLPFFHDNWSDYFDRIKIHNRYFPETAILIEGVHDQKVTPESGESEFLNDLNSESVLSSGALDALAMFRGGAEYTDPRRAGAYVVTRQPYVKISDAPLSQEQISDFLAKNNFFRISPYKHLDYYNPKGRVFLQDAHSGNVVSGFQADGTENTFLIDTPFRFAKEADTAEIEQFNKTMRAKLINGKISEEKYAELKPFLTDPKAPDYWEGGPQFSIRNLAVVPERYTGTEESERRSKYAEPPNFLKKFDIRAYEPGGRFFDAETGEDLTDKTFSSARIAVVDGKPSLTADDAASEMGSGPLFRTNLFKQKAGWKWVSEDAPDTSTIVSIEGQGKHVYAMQADFQNGVTMSRYPDKASEPRLRPTGRGELQLGEQIGTIDIRGREHPVYDSVTIGEAPEAERPIRGINVNDSGEAFTDMIFRGEKTIETRDQAKSLSPYVGKRVGIISTGKGKATLKGYADIGEPIEYRTPEEFRAAENQHRVPEGSKFDIKPGQSKFGFPLSNVELLSEPKQIPVSGRVASNLSDIRFSLTNEGSPGALEGIQMEPREEERLPESATRSNKGTLSDVKFSIQSGKSITSEEEMMKLDSLGNKKAKQTEADTLPYPVNPNVDSVTLPPRYGLVNDNIVGMPKSFKDVQTLLNNLTTRLTNVAYRDPQFALESASFYSDMADSALKLADAVKPDVSGMEKWLSSELNMRFLALGSPKSAVAANATKSGSSVAGSASDFAAGFKIGMGEQAMGAKVTKEAWERGEHFDLSLPGVQDKVRSFYLNGLAELIELAQKEGDAAAVKELMLRAGKSMRVFDPAETKLDAAGIAEVQRLLDGKATVDMWDMAAKGEAWPGYLMTMSERNKKTEPFQWSQDKFEKKSSLSTPQWQKVLKELKVSGPQDLRYQQARALKIDGNAAWDEVSWEARKNQPFLDNTPFSYYTKATEAGLSPGGGGPLYDAQQAIDGMLADRINELGLAKMFGKDKLKARNSQEILWALEKLDNPIKRNNDLSLFKASFDPFMDEIMALRGIPTAARSHLGRNVLGAMDRTYGEMARQVMPLEVVSSGTSVEAQAIQKKIADLQAGGDTNAAKTLTDWVADGLHDAINTFAEKHGLKVTADQVAVGEGGYTEAAQLNIAPNMRLVLRGDPAQTYQVLEALSRALDQDGGNIIRKPSVRELNDAQKVKNQVLTFDTTKLSQADRNSFFLEAAKLVDADGNPFLTGFTETETGLAVGNQFYSGDFEASIALNQQQLQALTAKYGIPKMGLEIAIIDTFYRGQDASKTTVSPFAKAIYGHIANRLSATPQAASFPQAVNFETLWRERADSLKAAIEQYPIRTKPQIKKAKANAPQIASATKQTQAHTELKSQLLAAVLRDEISKDRYKALMAEYGYAKGESDESDE